MAFNRLHLAAALLEYDNDNPGSGSAPRNAKDSIMFKAFERPKVAPTPTRDDPRKSWVTQREPERSLPPPDDSEDDYEDDEAGQVNLASWGLPEDFIAEDSPKRRMSAHTRPASALHSTAPMTSPTHRRPHSIHLDSMADDAIEEIRALSPGLRDTIDSLPISEPNVGNGPGPRSRTKSHDAYGSVLAEAERVRGLAEGHTQVMRSSMISHTPSAPILRDFRTSSDATPLRTGTLLQQSEHNRRQSSASLLPFPTSPPRAGTSLTHYNDPEILEDEYGAEANPFALPPPPASQVSRFDPKAAAAARPTSRSRHHSSGSMASRLSIGSRAMMDRAGASSRATVLDKHGRPVSTFAPESPKRVTLLDKHGNPVDPPESPNNRAGVLYDRKSLLFPKVLVMPTPLQPSLPVDNSEATFRDGFKVGEKPLPAASRPLSLFPSMPSSNSVKRLSTMSATPRNLTLSQATFRSSLLVGGQREDAFIGGAIQDGDVGWERADDDDYDDDDPRKGTGKPVGALYGTSLMDQLEARKKALKSKQRVFAGDARPSMMARQPSDRQSTLIDPATLNLPPTEATSPPRRQGGRQRLPHSKSVFGVDEVWEKEVAKLKLIEEREQAALEEEEEKERAKAAKREKKGKKSRKGKERAVEPDAVDAQPPQDQYRDSDISPIRRMPELPPTLQYSPEKASIPIGSHQDDEHPGDRLRSASKLGVGNWSASSDEESDGGRRARRRVTRTVATTGNDSSSEDEIPLSKQFNIAARPQAPESESSDEDIPLSKLVPNARGLPSSHPVESDDDAPLGLRHSAPARDEDDLPLGVQHQNAAQMQYMQQMQLQMAMQQQQQMAVQQQQQEMFMRQSMFMPSAGVPFPSFDPYAMMAPPQPQVQAAGIDRWRREVPIAPSAAASSVSGRR